MTRHVRLLSTQVRTQLEYCTYQGIDPNIQGSCRQELFVKRNKAGPRSGKHDLESWKDLAVFCIEVRRLRRNIFLLSKSCAKRKVIGPSPHQQWRRKEKGLKLQQERSRWDKETKFPVLWTSARVLQCTRAAEMSSLLKAFKNRKLVRKKNRKFEKYLFKVEGVLSQDWEIGWIIMVLFPDLIFLIIILRLKKISHNEAD